MSTKTKKIVRRKRNGKTVVPVIGYFPEPLHRAVKDMAKRQGTTQDALLNRWATNAVNGSKGALKQKRERHNQAAAIAYDVHTKKTEASA